MKFHNQKSFMGHEISNVTNKPLLHKKGKQWIVVAISALVLAGFGGMVSTTTHADTTATQPSTTKVVPKPANNPARATTPASSTTNTTKPSSTTPVVPKVTQPNTKNIGQQATDLHVKLLSQAPVKTNSSNLKATPNPSQHVKASGYWMYAGEQANNETPQWNLYSDGNLVISKNSNSNSSDWLENKSNTDNSQWASSMSNLKEVLGPNMTSDDARQVTTLSFNHVIAPPESTRLLDDEAGNGYFNNLSKLDLRGLSLSHVTDGTAMFGGLRGLTNVTGLKTPQNFNASLLFVGDKSLKSINLSNMLPISSSTGGMFTYDDNLTTITLGPNNSLTGSELFNGDGISMPSKQSNWTGLDGTQVTVSYNNNNALPKNSTFNVTGTQQSQATDTIKYINSENGKPILCKNIHPGHGGDYATLTGTYGTYVPSSVWGDWVATNMPAFDTLTQHPNPNYPDDINPSNLNSKNIKYDGFPYTVQITPNQAKSTVNYVDQHGNNEGSYTFTGDSDNANGAVKQTFGYDPAGLNSDYYVIKPFDQIQFDNGTHTEYVAPKVNQPINYQWFDSSVGHTTMPNMIPGTTANITSNGLNQGWHLNNGTYQVNSNGTFTVPQNGSTINDGVEPNTVTDTIAYQYNGTTLATTNYYKGDSYYTHTYPNTNTSFTLSKTPVGMPTGFHLANSLDANTSRKFDGTTQNIAITPKQVTDTIDYKYNNSTVSTIKSTGNDAFASGAGNTSFTVSAPSNYSLSVGARSTFSFNGGSYSVSIVPNNVNNTIYYKGSNGYTYSSNSNVSGLYSTSSSVSAPSEYSYIKDIKGNDGTFTYGPNKASHTFYVEPNPASEAINYIYNNGKKSFNEGSTVMNNRRYNESGNITSSNDNGLSSEYRLSNTSSNPFTYTNSNFNVNVLPSIATDKINYQYNGSTVSSSSFSGNYVRADDASDTSFTISNIPNDLAKNYHLANKSQTFNYDGGTYNVAIEPNTATDHITFNGDFADNTSMTGSYGTSGSVSAPSGYHFTDSKSTETFTYNSSTASFSVAPNTETEKINYVYHKGNGTFGEGSTTMKGSYGSKGNVTSNNASGLNAGYQLASANNSNNFTYANGGASDNVKVVPKPASATVNYKYDSTTFTHQFKGNDYRATDAGNNSVTISTNNAPELPAGWHVVNYSSNIPFNNGTYSVPVAPDSATDTIDYQYNNQTLASASFIGNSFGDSSASDTKFTISSSNEPKMPANYHLASNATFKYDGNTYSVSVLPNKVSDTINYVDNMGDTSNVTVSGTYNTKVSNSDITSHVPLNNKVVNSNNSFIFDGHSHKVEVIPQKTDTIRYVNGDDNSLIRSASFSGNDVYDNVSDTTFNANTQVPNGYHVASDNEFNYDGQSHNVTVYPNTLTIKFNNGDLGNIKVSDLTGSTYKLDLNKLPKYYHLANNSSDTINLDSLGKSVDYNINVVPNTVTVNYMNGNNKISSDTATFDGKDNTISDNFGIPVGYQLVNNQTSLSYDNQTTNVAVEPIPQTNTINYMNGSSKVSSTKSTGNDYQAQSAGNTTFTISNAPTNYHLANGNQTFNYDGSTDNVSVAPNTITVTYKSGSSAVGSDTVAYQSGSKVNNDYDMPAGYQLAQSNNQLNFSKASNAVDVLVKPVNKTDTINYMYNDTKVGSTQANGVDVYANGSAFNANTKVPAGYHAVDANNGFYYDGQQHDVSVAPNVDTDTVDYQANGQTLASQQFQGNDENATQAGDNSFDVTAKNATKMPNGYELVNKDNEFGFDNGSHNVAVQAVPQPQPSVPFMPSMPASSASSASSSASAPASMAMPSSSATTKSQSASHYRYAKVVTPLQLHTSKHFTKKNGVLTVEHPTEFKIMKIVRDHKYTRYEVKYQGRNYFITANDHFTINDYVQKHDFKSHKHMMVKVIKPMIEYKRSRFNRKYAIKVFKKGAILPVKRVFNFGKGEKTRFELTNGRFVTSNKLFVKVIK